MNNEKPVFASVDEYISSFPEPTQAKLNELRALILKLVPGAEEKFSYGMPAYVSGRMRLYFAAYARHIGFYPGAETIGVFMPELSNFKTMKGTLQLPLSKDLPLSLLERMIRFRLSENGGGKKK